MLRPDYNGGSIVNLMSSIRTALDGGPGIYPPLSTLGPARLSAARNVVLFVVDGLGYNYLTQIGSDGPLQRYLEGRISSVFPPTTATAITTFLTGMAPQQHGLTGWFMYFKELGNIVAVLLCRPRHGGPPLGKLGIDAKALFDHAPMFDQITAHSYLVVPRRIARSDFNSAHTGKARRKPYETLEQFFAAVKSIIKGRGKQRRYVHAYWPELDRLAHVYGIGSEEAARHLRTLGHAFERFLHEIEGTETLAIVTADHGIVDSGPRRLIELDDHPELADTLVMPLCGDRRLAYCYAHPDKRVQFENYVQAILAEYTTLHHSHELLEKGYFGLGPAHPKLHERIGHYTLAMKGNYTIKDWLLGEHRHVHIGAHGGVSEDEMYVPLIIVEA